MIKDVATGLSCVRSSDPYRFVLHTGREPCTASQLHTLLFRR